MQVTDVATGLLCLPAGRLQGSLQSGDVCPMVGLMTRLVTEALFVNRRLTNESIAPLTNLGSPTRCVVTRVEHLKFERRLSFAGLSKFVHQTGFAVCDLTECQLAGHGPGGIKRSVVTHAAHLTELLP